MLDLSQFAIGAFAIIGFVNGAQLAFNRDWMGFGKFAVAVVAGLVFGFMKWFGLPSMEVGLMVALGSSGAYKAIQKFTA